MLLTLGSLDLLAAAVASCQLLVSVWAAAVSVQASGSAAVACVSAWAWASAWVSVWVPVLAAVVWVSVLAAVVSHRHRTPDG